MTHIENAGPEALDEAISEFRRSHGEVLMAPGHPDHAGRVGELTRLYQRRFAASGEEGATTGAMPAQAPAQQNGFAGETARDLADWMARPDGPDGYAFRPGPIPETVRIGDGRELAAIAVDPAFEADARGWLHEAGASAADGAALHAIYMEEMNLYGFTDRRREALAETSMRHLAERYGEGQMAALEAARRVVREIDARRPAGEGRPGFAEFLDTTGLGNHPRVIDGLVRAARQRGWFEG